jgi:hypothetical protein
MIYIRIGGPLVKNIAKCLVILSFWKMENGKWKMENEK